MHLLHRQVIGRGEWNLRLERANVAHHCVHPFELLECAPSGVVGSPIRSGGQPHRERLCEVFIGMLLRVPSKDVAHMGPRQGVRRVVIGVGQSVVPEQRSEFKALVQAECVIHRMSCLVAEVAHRLVVTLDRPGVLGLDSLESRIREIERNANEWRSVWASPLIAEIDRRLERDPSRRQFGVEPLDELLDPRPANRESKLRDSSAEELRPLRFPFTRSVHALEGGKWRTEPSAPSYADACQTMLCTKKRRGKLRGAGTPKAGSGGLSVGIRFALGPGRPFVRAESGRGLGLATARDDDSDRLLVLQFCFELLHIDAVTIEREKAPGTVGGQLPSRHLGCQA